MCETCGCGQPHDTVTFQKPREEPHHHVHDHHHEHGHSYEHDHHQGQKITVEQNILSKNNLLAERNRGYFEAKKIFTLNLVSSPGSGKTTLLEKSIHSLSQTIPITVIEGDQQTLRDANRIDSTGVPVIQVNTGTGCHLDAEMIHHAIEKLNPEEKSLLFIENVGNLVCPALFDLGEAKKVVIISVTEGDDKPYKYPTMFDAAEICIINKIDLLPYVEFDVAHCRQAALAVNHHLKFFELSATTGEGMDNWTTWLKGNL